MGGAKFEIYSGAVASVPYLAGNNQFKRLLEREAVAALERKQSAGLIGGEVDRRHVELSGGSSGVADVRACCS